MIINASPLIILGKLNKMEILKKIYPNIEISKAVYDEVVIEGMKKNAPDAQIIKEHIDKKHIKIYELSAEFASKAKRMRQIYGIDIGEAETIALALQLKERDIIIDEISARETAKSLGVKPIGTLRILLLAYEKKLIKKNDIKEAVIQMQRSKYRLGPAILLEFWELFDKLK